MQMFEHRLNQIQDKVDQINPVFMMNLESRIEEFQRDVYDLRNLYQSPSSSLNRVIDGLLKKVKTIEVDTTSKLNRSNLGLSQYGDSQFGGVGGGAHNRANSFSRSNANNDNLSYVSLTNRRLDQIAATPYENT